MMAMVLPMVTCALQGAGQLPRGTQTLAGMGILRRKVLPGHWIGGGWALSIYLLWHKHVRAA